MSWSAETGGTANGLSAATSTRMATPAKDSQKPGTSGAKGSTSSTASITAAKIVGPPTARRRLSKMAAVSSITTERNNGTLNPASSP